MTARQIQVRLRRMANTEIASQAHRFIKNGKGEYGEGYKFLGIRITALRPLIKECKLLPVEEVLKLLMSGYHEERWLALQILVARFQKATESERRAIYRLYMKNTRYIDGWDLVDCSAYKIIGPYLENRNRSPLYKLAKSGSMWERRIAIMSTFHFIRKLDYRDAIEISRILLNDDEDLIHKAVGWMLREIGNRNRNAEKKFLRKYCKVMPRTMLRYAIEKFPQQERRLYLQGRA